MGTRSFEVIVIGCGGIGSAAAYWLSRELGDQVLGIEQFPLGHERGASQDYSRIIRLSYHDPVYVNLARAAYDSWRHIEAESGVRLLTITGGLDLEVIGTTGAKDVEHCSRALVEHGVEHELLDARELMRRWPQLHLTDDVRGLYQAASGIVDARAANAVHVALARANGATIIAETPVREIRAVGGTVDVVTADGTIYSARRLVIASGAWTNRLIGSLRAKWPLTVTQEQVTYFATPNVRDFAPDRFPIFIWRAQKEFYGLPIYGEVATKIGQDAAGDEVTADTRTFTPNRRLEENVEAFLTTYIPGFLGPTLYTKTCLYTMPPDRHFVVGPLESHPEVIVAVGAGHAFKFASLLGSILGNLALKGHTEHEIGPFRTDRPALADPEFPAQFRNELVLSHGERQGAVS